MYYHDNVSIEAIFFVNALALLNSDVLSSLIKHDCVDKRNAGLVSAAILAVTIYLLSRLGFASYTNPDFFGLVFLSSSIMIIWWRFYMSSGGLELKTYLIIFFILIGAMTLFSVSSSLYLFGFSILSVIIFLFKVFFCKPIINSHESTDGL